MDTVWTVVNTNFSVWQAVAAFLSLFLGFRVAKWSLVKSLSATKMAGGGLLSLLGKTKIGQPFFGSVMTLVGIAATGYGFGEFNKHENFDLKTLQAVKQIASVESKSGDVVTQKLDQSMFNQLLSEVKSNGRVNSYATSPYDMPGSVALSTLLSGIGATLIGGIVAIRGLNNNRPY